MLPIARPGDGWQTGRVPDDQTSTVRGDAEFIARAGHLFDAVREEFVLAARDLAAWSQPEVRSAVARRVRSPGKRRATVRKLWSPLVLVDEAQRAHLRQIDTAGTRVRMSSAPLPRDDHPGSAGGDPGEPAAPLGREYQVTTSPGTGGRGLFAVHRRLGGSHRPRRLPARRSPRARSRGPGDPAGAGAGLTDEVAARRLGTSLRTYRRRVAELMAALKAGSRFQAEVRAGELGLARQRGHPFSGSDAEKQATWPLPPVKCQTSAQHLNWASIAVKVRRSAPPRHPAPGRCPAGRADDPQADAAISWACPSSRARPSSRASPSSRACPQDPARRSWMTDSTTCMTSVPVSAWSRPPPAAPRSNQQAVDGLQGGSSARNDAYSSLNLEQRGPGSRYCRGAGQGLDVDQGERVQPGAWLRGRMETPGSRRPGG